MRGEQLSCLTVVRPMMGFWPKTVGSFTMNGMRVADSKFVIFAHCEFSPSW